MAHEQFGIHSTVLCAKHGETHGNSPWFRCFSLYCILLSQLQQLIFFLLLFDHQNQLNKVQIGVGRASVMQTGFIRKKKLNSVKYLQCWMRWRLICIEINFSIDQCLFNNATTHRVFDTVNQHGHAEFPAEKKLCTTPMTIGYEFVFFISLPNLHST